MGLHFYLTFHYHQVQLGTAEGPSTCNINSTFNCDSVAVSDFSAVSGIPIAAFGFSTNLVLALLLLLVLFRLTETPEKLMRMSFYLSGFSVLASVVMGLISITQLSTYCLYCIGLYVLSILLFATLWKQNRQESNDLSLTALTQDIKGFIATPLWPAVFALSIPVVALFLHKSIESNLHDGGGGVDFERLVTSSVNDWQSNPKINFDTPASLVKGNTQASSPITIVEFADFRCGHCQKASLTLATFVKANPDTQLHFYNFPLDGACNSNIPQSNGVSCRLAKAAHCGAEQKKGWLIHDTIFSNQKSFYSANTRDDVDKKIKKLLGNDSLDWKALSSCMDSTETHDAIRKQTELAKRAEVQGTPKIFMNGKALPAGQLIPVLKKARKLALKNN